MPEIDIRALIYRREVPEWLKPPPLRADAGKPEHWLVWWMGCVVVGAITGVLFVLAIGILGLLKIAVLLPFIAVMSTKDLANELAQLPGLLWWALKGGVTAGITAGILSPLTHWRVMVFPIGIVTGVVFGGFVGGALGMWQGLATFIQPVPLIWGTIYGLSFAFLWWRDPDFRRKGPGGAA